MMSVPRYYKGFQDGWHAPRVMWQDQTIISGLGFTGAKHLLSSLLYLVLVLGPFYAGWGAGFVASVQCMVMRSTKDAYSHASTVSCAVCL